MTDLQRLLAIEAIKQLKARYFRAIDFKGWDELRSVFTADAVFDVRDALAAPGAESRGGEPPIEGVDAIVAFARAGLDQVVSMHLGHSPLIEIVDDRQAAGWWPMEDWLHTPAGTFHGQGHYHELYRCEEGQWRIARLRITRQHVSADFDTTTTIPPIKRESGE